MPVWRAKQEIGTRGFLSWLAYERICPFDMGYANVCAAVYGSQGAKDVDPMDFTAYGKRRIVTMDEMMQRAASSGATRTYGSKDNGEPDR